MLRHLLANVRKTHELHSAVITVPATFTFQQREATQEAAQTAGIQVMVLVVGCAVRPHNAVALTGLRVMLIDGVLISRWQQTIHGHLHLCPAQLHTCA